MTEIDNCAVKIAVRERPLRESSKAYTESSVVVYHPNSNILIVDERPFTFDYVLGANISQSQLYDRLIKPTVLLFKQGFNCTALAYGQTGTGKSYTMGLDSINFEDESIGVIPRVLNEIFTDQARHRDSNLRERQLSVSFIEIYNEKVYDLLADNSKEPIIAKGCKYTGGSSKKVCNIQDCYTILIQGNKNRHVRPTKMNSQSSRSHAIFTIHQRLTSIQISGDESVVYSCLNLVDLAGSEGVRRTGHQGVAMSEGVNINQGLLSIGKVLQAMTVGSKVIPYRDSALSSVLQDSLNANSYLTLLACISPHREDLSETLSTLRFAQSAKQLKNNPQINNIIAEIKKNAKMKKTPYREKPFQIANKPTPFKRASGCQSRLPSKTSLKSNTFCTPKKQRYEVNRCNQTDIVGSHQRPKLSSIRMNLPKMDRLNSTNNRDSTFNRSLELNASLSSLNISSSTANDCAQNKKASNQNFSPVIRKCLSELETGLEKKLGEIIQRNLQTFITPQTPATVVPFQNALPSMMRSEIKSIMKEILAEDPATTCSPLQITAKCQLFGSSTEIFKVPAVPTKVDCPKLSSPNAVNDCDTSSFTTTFFKDQKILDNKSVRRSMRLSQRFDAENLVTLNNSNLSSEHANNTLRRSMRKSVLKTPQVVGGKNGQLPCCHSPIMKKKKAQQSKNRLNSSSTIMENCYSGTTLSKHRKVILDLLNNGSRKEVQILPMIGQKRAFQIVTHRTLHGKFKTLAQLEKLPFWRGNEWNRFVQANFLS